MQRYVMHLSHLRIMAGIQHADRRSERGGGNVIRIIYYMKHSAACVCVCVWYKRNIKNTFKAT
jgi:hypothetical protein